jgi:hypothetical protein
LPEPAREPESAAEQPPGGSGADLEPEDLVMKDPSKPAKQRRPRNRRHGRAR